MNWMLSMLCIQGTILLYVILLSCVLSNIFLCFTCCRGYIKGLERQGKRTFSSWARTWTNYWSTFSLQLWRLWKDIHRCRCFEEAFSHPWREAICLPLWGMWKGNESVISDTCAYKHTCLLGMFFFIYIMLMLRLNSPLFLVCHFFFNNRCIS